MNQENYASYEASKRLIEAGIVLETEAVWALVPNLYVTLQDGSSPGIWKLINKPLYPYKEQYPAPSMAEVWKELPEEHIYHEKAKGFYEHSVLTLTKHRGGYVQVEYPSDYYGFKLFDNKNPTDALIDLLIWVREGVSMNCINCGSRVTNKGCLCTPAEIKMDREMTNCPFCGEEDFDLTGLKVHLTWCEAFEKTLLPNTDGCNTTSMDAEWAHHVETGE